MAQLMGDQTVSSLEKDTASPVPAPAAAPETTGKARRQPAPVGSRRWFWNQRAEHSSLFAVMLLPLFQAGWSFAHPQFLHHLGDADQDRVAAGYVYERGTGSQATSVWVHVHSPHLGERFVAAAPGLLLAVMFGLVGYALWRIEINLAAGHRLFTPKDRQFLNWAARAFAVATCAILLVLWRPGQFREAFQTMDPFWALLAIGVLLNTMRRIYSRAMTTYDALTRARAELEGLV